MIKAAVCVKRALPINRVTRPLSKQASCTATHCVWRHNVARWVCKPNLNLNIPIVLKVIESNDDLTAIWGHHCLLWCWWPCRSSRRCDQRPVCMCLYPYISIFKKLNWDLKYPETFFRYKTPLPQSRTPNLYQISIFCDFLRAEVVIGVFSCSFSMVY